MLKPLPLNNLWINHGAEFGEFNGWRLPSYISPVIDEYTAAQLRPVLYDLSYRGKITVSGKDRVDFLHRVLTNNIKTLKPGQGCYAAFLSATGKVLTDMWVWIFLDFILLDVEMNIEQKTIELLNRFIVCDDVTLTDATSQYIHLAMTSPTPHGELDAIFPAISNPRAFGHVQKNIGSTPVILMKQQLVPYSSYQILIETQHHANKLDDPWKMLGDGQWLAVGTETAEILRIQSGILRYGQDITEHIALSDTGLDSITVDSEKGCYPGQEVVARTATYGGPKQQFLRGQICRSSFPCAGDILYEFEPDGVVQKKIGVITSFCKLPTTPPKGIFLALCDRKFVPEKAKTNMGVSGQDAKFEWVNF